MDMSIRFPGINLVLDYVPRAFQIFGMEFTIYGMIIAVGALLGMGLVVLEAGRNHEDQNKYLDMMILSLAASVVGSRLFYVIFSWELYQGNLRTIFDVRNGGYAFYGGLLGGVLAAALFCRLAKLSFWQMADTVSLGVLLGQVVGRWGNFFNRESFGEYTDGVLAMQLPISAVRSGEVSGAMRDNLLTIEGVSFIQVQPVFLYESLWCLFLLLVLLALRRKKRYQGELFMWYLAGYGLGRFVCEWLRTDKLYIPGTSVDISLLISGVLVVVFVPIVTVRRVMVKKRADIRKIRRERVFREEEESRREHKPVDKKPEEPAEKQSEKPPVQEEETIQEDKIQGETDNWENLEYAHIPSQWRKSSDQASEKQEE